jgi:hypothetical protein
MYDGGLSESDIDKPLMFRLNDPDTANKDCMGRRNLKDGAVKANLSDYKRTKMGLSDQLKEFKTFPCFVIRDMPKVIDRS